MPDGEKLKPYVIFKGVRQDPNLLNYPGVVVTYSQNGKLQRHGLKRFGESYPFKGDF